MNRTFSDGARRHFVESYQPLTNALLAAAVLIFLADFGGAPVHEWTNAPLPMAWYQPWRLFTAPLDFGGIIGLIFGGFIFYQAGGSLERSWGTKTFAIFYAALCLVNAAAFSLASPFNFGIGAPGYYVMSALIVGFCCVNPDETINLYGIIPVKTRYIAVGICVIIFFSVGYRNIFLGLMALGACGFAVLWATQDWAYRVSVGAPSVPMPKVPRKPNLRLVDSKPRPRDDKFSLKDLNPIRWLNKRNERKKFERMMRDD